MRNNHEETRRNITPQPRKPIRSAMGRYGVNQPTTCNMHNNFTNNEQNDQELDEVDNIMSKMVRPSSPLRRRIKKIQRSNSCSDSQEYNDNTNILSKSLPAHLPSYLYSSDDSEMEEEPSLTKSRAENIYSNDEIVNEFSFTKSKAEDSFDYSRGSHNRSDLQTGLPHIQVPYSELKKLKTAEESQNKSKLTYIILPALFVIVIAIIFRGNILTNYFSSTQTTIETLNSHAVAFENNMNHLKEKYNVDDDSILKIKTGISTIFSKMDAGSFMFLYNGTTDNFDSILFDRFINEVAHTAASYLRNNITPTQHPVIVSSNLDMQEHGELISKYRENVDRSGVMLVKDVDAVPADLAMAFHYYCDEYDPVVKKSAIFFTLNLANCSHMSGKKPTHDYIEKCLMKKWQSIPSENMRPLLTRIVDVIIDVTEYFKSVSK